VEIRNQSNYTRILTPFRERVGVQNHLKEGTLWCSSCRRMTGSHDQLTTHSDSISFCVNRFWSCEGFADERPSSPAQELIVSEWWSQVTSRRSSEWWTHLTACNLLNNPWMIKYSISLDWDEYQRG
jgi:hypothetical protein